MSNCKYYKQQRQVSYDGGQTWRNLNEFRKGNVYQMDASDCDTSTPLYRWVDMQGYTVCDGTTEYQKTRKQVSYDNGTTWEDLDEYGKSTVIEYNSSVCGYVADIYRWVDVSGYICDGTTKYGRQQRQVSHDGGNSWANVYPEQFQSNGTVIEQDSKDCGYQDPIYRWETVTRYCNGIDLYASQIRQVSNDGGETWTDVSPQETQDVVIEYESTQCGAGQYKLKSIASDSGTYYVYCTGDNTITSGNVKGNSAQIENVTSVTIGTCGTEIATNAFRNTSITSITIPSNITVIHNSTFAYSDLKEVHFESATPPSFGTNTFMGCQSLTTIYVPCGSLEAYKAVSNLSTWASKMVEDECGCVPYATANDTITAYTASTLAQTMSVGTFDIEMCSYEEYYYAYMVSNGKETGMARDVEVLDATPLDDNMYRVEFGLYLTSTSYTETWNIHFRWLDGNTNVKDEVIKTIKVTRQ